MAEFRRSLVTEKVTQQRAFGPSQKTIETDEVTIEGTADEICQIIIAEDQKDEKRYTPITFAWQPEDNIIRGID